MINRIVIFEHDVRARNYVTLISLSCKASKFLLSDLQTILKSNAASTATNERGN